MEWRRRGWGWLGVGGSPPPISSLLLLFLSPHPPPPPLLPPLKRRANGGTEANELPRIVRTVWGLLLVSACRHVRKYSPCLVTQSCLVSLVDFNFSVSPPPTTPVSPPLLLLLVAFSVLYCHVLFLAFHYPFCLGGEWPAPHRGLF